MENGTCTVLWRTPRLFLRLDRGPRVAWPPLSPVSDRDAAGDRRAHLRAPEPGSPDAHPAPGGRPRAQRKPGHSPAPGGARPVQEARLSAGQRRVRRTELRPRPPAYRMPFGLGSPVLSGGRRRNHDGKGADARREPMAGSTSCSATASGWPAKGRAWPTPTSRVPLAGDGSWATSTCNTTFRACIDTWRSWSRTRRCASPMPSRIACRRRAAGSSGRGDTGRSGEPPARLKSASAGPATVTCPWLRAGAPPARPRPATDRRPGSGLRRWRRARPGVRPG